MAMPAEVKGALMGLGAATLFGLSAPLSKLLLPTSGPLVLASLLYLGGGLGLSLFGLLAGLLRGGSNPCERPACVEGTCRCWPGSSSVAASSARC